MSDKIDWGKTYCEVNCFEWPEQFWASRPSGWDDMTNIERHKLPQLKSLFNVILMVTTREERSRAWWTIRLGRTEEEWQKWWDEGKHIEVPNTTEGRRIEKAFKGDI